MGSPGTWLEVETQEHTFRVLSSELVNEFSELWNGKPSKSYFVHITGYFNLKNVHFKIMCT